MNLLKKIKFNFAANVLIGMVLSVIVYHTLILLQVVSFENTWGGRIQNLREMYVMESISVTVIALIGLVIVMKAGYIRSLLPQGVLNFILWALVLLFLLNTLGNLFAKSWLEKAVATPATLLAAVLCARLAVEKAGAGN